MVNQRMHAFAEHFVRRIAQHPEAGRVDEGANAVGVHSENGLGRSFQQQTEAFLALAQGRQYLLLVHGRVNAFREFVGLGLENAGHV